jgi:hypothetical protein
MMFSLTFILSRGQVVPIRMQIKFSRDVLVRMPNSSFRRNLCKLKNADRQTDKTTAYHKVRPRVYPKVSGLSG